MPDDISDAAGVQERDPRVVASRARDAEWVGAALDGDAEAFARLYDAWSSRVFDLVVRIVPNRHVAQDVCQDVFFAAWRNLPNLQDRDAFGGWLLRIARNTALNQAARESRSRAVDDTSFFELMGAGPSGDVEARVVAWRTRNRPSPTRRSRRWCARLRPRSTNATRRCSTCSCGTR